MLRERAPRGQISMASGETARIHYVNLLGGHGIDLCEQS